MPADDVEKRVCRKCNAPMARPCTPEEVAIRLRGARAEAKLSQDRVDAYFLLQMAVSSIVSSLDGECAECACVYDPDSVLPKVRCNTCLQVDGVARVRLVSGASRKRKFGRG